MFQFPSHLSSAKSKQLASCVTQYVPISISPTFAQKYRRSLAHVCFSHFYFRSHARCVSTISDTACKNFHISRYEKFLRFRYSLLYEKASLKIVIRLRHQSQHIVTFADIYTLQYRYLGHAVINLVVNIKLISRCRIFRNVGTFWHNLLNCMR